MHDENDTPSGLGSALVGLAGFLGGHRLTESLGDLSADRFANMKSGVSIKAPAGTPLEQIAEFTGEEVRAISDFAKQRGVKVPILVGDPARASSHYVQGKHIGLRDTSIPGAMHEIGHAAPVLGSPAVDRRWKGLLSALKRHPAIGQMVRGAVLANVLAPPDDESGAVRKLTYEHAPALMAATQLPELAEEGRATLHAIRGAKGAGIPARQTLRELAPALGTYMARAAAPILATVLAKKLVEALRSSGSQEKQAGDPKASGLLTSTASSAWRIGGSPPKPQSTNPKWGSTVKAKLMEPAKPPSNQPYFRDVLKSLYDPSRGFRPAAG